MIFALGQGLDGLDKLVVTAAALALVALVHAAAYTSAESSLRPQRIMLRRGADLLGVAVVAFCVQLWAR